MVLFQYFKKPLPTSIALVFGATMGELGRFAFQCFD